MAQAGDVLALNAVLRGSSYETSVKTLEQCRTDFIPRAELIQLMETSQVGAHALLNILSHELTELTDRARSLLLPQTASGRLARLLLEWSKQSERIDKVFTHEEIAQMICSSRETVTRLLTSMSRGKVIGITSNCILIRNCAALERMALA
jgi:CRP/FNR family transcriptional regulator